MEDFRRLARFPAFGRELLPGNIGSLLRVKCPEEIGHYLSYIWDSWSYLFDGVEAPELRLDPRTIEIVRLRNVMFCKTDHDFLEPLVRRGAVFESFRSSERQIIWRNMKRFRARIPSLGVFFEDFKYLEDLAACVKPLFNCPRGQTLREVMDQSFVSSHTGAATGHEAGPPGHTRNSRTTQFDIARRRLFLFVMRHLENLRPGSILLEGDGVREVVEITPRSRSQLFKEAHKLGFRSENILHGLDEDPDRQEARQSLLRARNPQDFAYDEMRFESLVDRLVRAYREAERIEDRPSTCVFIADDGESLKRRCGRPFRQAFVESARYITLENMHVHQVSGFGELTPIFVRRDVYLAFFGPLNSAHLHPGTPETPPVPDPTGNVLDSPSSLRGTSAARMRPSRDHSAQVAPTPGDTALPILRQISSNDGSSPRAATRSPTDHDMVDTDTRPQPKYVSPFPTTTGRILLTK